MTILIQAVSDLYDSTTDEMTISQWFGIRGIPQDELTTVTEVLIKSAAEISQGDAGSFLAGIALIGMQIGWMAHAGSVALEEAA